ncbi:hypothetical protein FDP41_002923 [Naegleria fowleri]|uniref:Uncharacterized protein n=1 Tax=Naegleria fowleri TaxID=5763 RepID=A0A6A5BE80_NAEFO|nr:uncharacterized protein FDP41_009452 [Naegleria fowleri]XP_044562744.1 uncharacterized protein FDP41_002923 [Naegleria fowleri]KAF0972248.1 hypothetical protein FDP41_009452 [Naegleria fowleri]KAF0978031.1 hypothetical protein FDP41_002923 [Naegleria fowleri]
MCATEAFNFMRNWFLAHNEFPDLFINMFYRHHGEKDYFEQIQPFLKHLVKANLEKYDQEEIMKRLEHQYPNFSVFLEECKKYASHDSCSHWFYSRSQIREAFSYMEQHDSKMVAKNNLTTTSYYDIVFRLSPEVMLETRIDLVNFTMDPNTFYTSQLYSGEGVNDEIGFGSIKVMRTYSSLLLKAEKLASITLGFHPQLYLKNHLLEKRDVKLLPIGYRRLRGLEFAHHGSEIREPFDDLIVMNDIGQPQPSTN